MEFKPYETLEDMFSAMEMHRHRADQSVQPFQAAASPGDHYLQRSGYGFDIYGRILEEEEPRPQRLQHYRFVEAYSVACPEGEIGDMHVSSIEQILSETEFSEARERGWEDYRAME